MGYIIFMIWVAAAAAVGAWIGYSVKGRPLTGFLLGVFLGWLGVLILAFLPRTAEKKVQSEMRDQAIRKEAARRSAGLVPWHMDEWDQEQREQRAGGGHP